MNSSKVKQLKEVLIVLIQLSLRFFPGIYDKRQENKVIKKD